MADFTFIQPTDFSPNFTVATTGLGGDITVNLVNLSLTSTDTGNLIVLGTDNKPYLPSSAIPSGTIISTDAGQLLTAAPIDGGVFMDQAGVQSAETPFTPIVGAGSQFLAVASGGTNGHAPTLTVDYADPAFVEAVQDAAGALVVSAVDGLVYDDALNSLASSLGNVIFGNGLQSSGTTSVSVLSDPASPYTVTAAPSGLSVTPVASSDADNLFKVGSDSRALVTGADIKALATIEICDLAGNVIAKAYAP